MKRHSALTFAFIFVLLTMGYSNVPVRGVAAATVDRYEVSRIGGATCLTDLISQATETCSADAKGILEKAIGKLAAGRTWQEKVTVKGDFMIDNSVDPLAVPSYTILELLGSLKAQAYDKTLVIVNGSNVTLTGGTYDGNRGQHIDTADTPIRVIQLSDAYHVLVQDVRIVDGYGRGLEVDDGGDNLIQGVEAQNCWRNFMFWSTDPSIPRNHRAEGLTSRFAQGGNGIDFGTVGHVTISGIESQEDNPVAVSIDSSNHVSITNLRSLYRGFALVYAGYNNTEEILLENAQSLGSGGGGFAAEIRSNWNIKGLTLANVSVANPRDDALAFLRTGGSGTISHIRVSDLQVSWTGAAKCDVRATPGVQDIAFSSAPDAKNSLSVFRRIDPSSSEVCDRLPSVSSARNMTSLTPGPTTPTGAASSHMSSTVPYATTLFGIPSLSVASEPRLLASQSNRYRPDF
jgi:hypothetical protein